MRAIHANHTLIRSPHVGYKSLLSRSGAQTLTTHCETTTMNFMTAVISSIAMVLAVSAVPIAQSDGGEL